MTVIEIIISVTEILVLTTITGVLTSLVAFSLLIQCMFMITYPICLLLLRHTAKLLSVEIILSDISTKVPCLQCFLRPEYAPYFNTAGTVLLGWMIVCWLSNVIWIFLAPLAISILGVIIVCPTTVKWFLGQFGPSTETILDDILQKVQLSLLEIR